MKLSHSDAATPMRVLHVVQRMEAAGIQAMLMNLYRHIDRSKVQFDFLVLYEAPQFHDEEIKSLGGRIYRTSLRENGNLPQFLRRLRMILQKEDYKVVHVHADTVGYIPLREAKKAGVPHRIAHSHNAAATRDLKVLPKRIMQRLFPVHATELVACTDMAGRYMFGRRPFEVVVNAIDAEQFAFDDEVRANVRAELGITDEFVIGHVGRMHAQKNPLFVLDTFAALQAAHPNSALVLVGTGPMESAIREKALAWDLKNVLILGNRSDIDRIYQAMDVFMLPSLFEGLGIVAVEAQAANTTTIVSTAVPDEAIVSEFASKLPLSAGPAAWAAAALETRGQEGVRAQRDGQERVVAAGFDVRAAAARIQEEYLLMNACPPDAP